MANRVHDKLWALGQDRVLMQGRFRPNGAGAVDNDLNKGLGFSVARDSAGVFTITFEDRFRDLESGDVQVFADTATDLQGQVGAVDTLTAGTVVIRLLAGATPTDLADDANNWFRFSSS